MKKTLLLLSVFTAITLGAFSQACMPDTTHFTSNTFIYPDTLPTIDAGQPFSGVISIKVPDSLSLGDFISALSILNKNVYIDSVKFDAITGDPAGISSVSVPALGTTWLKPGQFACAIFTGTTTAATGSYPLTITGEGCGHFTYSGTTYDSCFQNFSFSRIYPYHLSVSNSNAIAVIADGLSLNIYPNPNQGNFNVVISSASRLYGTLQVTDALGRVITTQGLDVTGNKQIPLALGNVAPGAYLLTINAEGARSVKQFIVK